MDLYYIIVFFIIGSVLGSFYNVVGYRLPKGESIAYPASHCPNCNHFLKPIELIPIFSFLLQGGKCKNCGLKISWFYPIFEFTAGALFALSYKVFGLNLDLLIALTFISMLLIIVISDYHYMIISDEVLIFFGIAILIESLFRYNIADVGMMIFSGVISFLMMLSIKLFGDFTFKKESMGGGDIKLMLIIGFIIGWQNSILLVFIASIIALPVSLIILYRKKDHEIPFGPFLAVASLIIYLGSINIDFILNLMR